MSITNFDLMARNVSYVDSQICPASTTGFDISSAASIPKANDIFSELAKLLEQFSQKKIMTPLKIEKLSLLAGHTFDSTDNLEYINFPFEQSYDRKWIHEVDQAIDSNPSFLTKVAHGISSTYIIRDAAGKKIALFKPDDEASASTLAKLDSEQSALREHLAWALGKEFVDLPAAYVVKINVNGKPIQGSLQRFIDSEGNCQEILQTHWRIKQMAEKIVKPPLPWISLKQHVEDFVSEFVQASKLVDRELLSDYPSQIRGMALLDILIQNPDRVNPQNTLLKQEECGYRMIPIDHNLAFPKEITPLLFANAPWYVSEAVKQPFSDREIQWLNELDIEAVKGKLLDKGLDKQRVNAFGIMAELVQTSARAGLTLLDIATLLANPFSRSKPFPFSESINKILTTTNKEAVSEKIRKQIHNMVMEKRDEIAQFGMTDLMFVQKRTNELLGDKKSLNELLTTFAQADISLPLNAERQAIYDQYIKAGACPKNYFDPRFNTTRPGKPLEAV